MRNWWILFVILALALGGCSAETEVGETPTTVPTEPLTLVPSITPLTLDATPVSDLSEVNQLDAQTTFEVIAAVHAYVLMVEEWAAQDLSQFERQAVVYPLLEVGLSPLEDVFTRFQPDPALDSPFSQAASLSDSLGINARSWALGEWSDEEFFPVFDQDVTNSRLMIEQAVLAAEAIGIDTRQYGPKYVGAQDVVFRILPELETAPLPEATPARPIPNSDLVAVQVVPFLHQYAGSEVFLTIGLVENTSNQPLQQVEVQIAYYNFLDEHLGTVRGRLLAERANPGGVYPFLASDVIEGEEIALKDWTRYEVVVYANPAESEAYQQFYLDYSTSESTLLKFYIFGELTNRGDQSVALEHIHIGVMAFDLEGVLVGVGEGVPLDPGMLMPRESTGFEVVIPVLSGEPVEFRFFAEAAGQN